MNVTLSILRITAFTLILLIVNIMSVSAKTEIALAEPISMSSQQEIELINCQRFIYEEDPDSGGQIELIR